VISTDLSHFHSLQEANKKDKETIQSIMELNREKIIACGLNPLLIAFEYCRITGTKPQLIDYTTSAEVTGDNNSVVGYASFWF